VSVCLSVCVCTYRNAVHIKHACNLPNIVAKFLNIQQLRRKRVTTSKLDKRDCKKPIGKSLNAACHVRSSPSSTVHVHFAYSRDRDVRFAHFPTCRSISQKRRPLSGTSQFSRRFFAIPSAWQYISLPFNYTHYLRSLISL